MIKNKKLIVPTIKRLLFKKNFIAFIEITNLCNLHCLYCYHRFNAGKEVNIELPEWEKRFKEYYKAGIRCAQLIGGEPSLRIDIIRLACKIFPFVTVFTNGQIKIPSDLDLRIYLSLEGEKDVNDRIRGQEAFEKAIANYKDDKRVIIYTHLSKLNYINKDNIEQFIKHIKESGFQNMIIDYFVPQENKKYDFEKVLGKEQFKEVNEILNTELKKPDNFLISTKELLKRQANLEFSDMQCPLLKVRTVYGVDGLLRNKVGIKNDCRHCRLSIRYNPSVFNFLEWWRYKKMIYKVYFK